LIPPNRAPRLHDLGVVSENFSREIVLRSVVSEDSSPDLRVWWRITETSR
jgi:hypothetical protein